MKNKTHKTDVVIVGAGPVGLFAIFQCGMLGLKCHITDALPEIGGQCTALYPDKPIYDIPGYPQINAGQLIENLETQAAPFQPVYHLNQQAAALIQEEEHWLLSTSASTKIQCSAIIIAAGAGAFGPNKPPLEGIESYEGTSIFYMVRDAAKFAGKRIVIAGGGDSAVDWANILADYADHVTVVHRRDKFRAAPESVAKMKMHPNITCLIPGQVSALHGAGGQLKEIDIDDLQGGRQTLACDIFLPFFGLAAALGPIAEWGLGLDHQQIKTDPLTSMSSAEGIYAIGDIATYPNKLKLILTGFSEAAMAAHDIWRRLNKGKILHQEYSTTKGVPDLKDQAAS